MRNANQLCMMYHMCTSAVQYTACLSSVPVQCTWYTTGTDVRLSMVFAVIEQRDRKSREEIYLASFVARSAPDSRHYKRWLTVVDISLQL